MLRTDEQYNPNFERRTFFLYVIDGHVDHFKDYLNIRKMASGREQTTRSLERMFQESTTNKESDLNRYKKELQALRQQIGSVEKKNLLQSDMNPETFRSVIGELKEKEQFLTGKIAELEMSNEQMRIIIDEIIPEPSDIKGLFHELPLKSKHLLLDIVFNDSLFLEKTVFEHLT